MAKKASLKNKSTLYGSPSNDTLTVKHNQVTVFAGKGKKDVINVTKGSKHKIYGEAGTDVINIKSTGTGMKVYGDDDKGTKSKITSNDTFNIYKGKKNYFYGGKGTDTFNVYGGGTTKASNYLYGGAGSDVFVIGKDSTGKAVVKDFAANEKVKVSGNTSNIYASGKNMIIKGGKEGKAALTLESAKGKTFTVTDSNNSYTVDKQSLVGVKLKRNITGTFTAASFVTTIDARNVKNTIDVNGNAKANTIYVANADGGIFRGGSGKDTIIINGGNNHTVETGDAKDSVTINAGSGHFIKNTDNGGDDIITINKNAGSNISISGHNSANETVIVNGGDNHTIKLGDGNNKVTIAAGKNHYVLTGNNADSIIIDNAHVSYIATGAGDDTITIRNGGYVIKKIINSAADSRPIETGDGDDKVYIEANAGNGTYVTTGNGDDEIYVRGGKNQQIYPGQGNDTVSVTGGSGHGIHLGAESGRNTITLSAKDMYLNTNWNAADRITVNWGKDMGDNTINARGSNSEAIKDTLTIKNIKIDDFSFTVQNFAHSKDLVLSSDSGTITISNWLFEARKGFDGITFADGYLTYEQINQKAGF